MTDKLVLSEFYPCRSDSFGQSQVLQQCKPWVQVQSEQSHHRRDERHPATHAFESYQLTVLILHWDTAEFNQSTDEQDCSLTLCSRKPNAEQLICCLSCDRQVAGSFYRQIIKRLDWGSGITMKMCTKPVSLVSSFLTSQLFIVLLIISLSPDISISQSPLLPLVSSKSQWKTLSDKAAITEVKSRRCKMIL